METKREDFRLEEASSGDADAILALYHSVLDTPYCRWNEHYPCMANIEDDLSRNALFCIKVDGQIVAAISIDRDDAVEALDCWNKELKPAMELSRLCVGSAYQGKGIPALMIEDMMEYGRKKGIRSIHYLVSQYNLAAQRAYARLGFELVGECHMYEDDYFCYEKAL